MNVVMIASTPDALRVAFSAIRTCYSSSDFADIWENEYEKYKENNDDHVRLVKQIVSHGHTSTLEHISFTFSIGGISRACLAQLTRHRIASYSVRSQRYTKLSDIVPTNLDGNSVYEEAIAKVQQAYQTLLEDGVKAEDARMVLPQASSTNLVMTINLRSFINMYTVRKPGTHAQAEIQELVSRMKDAIVDEEPWTEGLFT
jgi:thymidylate synthase (FAD)